MVRFYVCCCRQNFCVFIAFLFGTFFSSFVLLTIDNQCIVADVNNEIQPEIAKILTTTSDYNDYEPRINLAGKPQKAQKTPQVLIRPRYFSTELGIKEKLFVGVLSSFGTVTSFGVGMNKTVSHNVDKIMFFIDSPGQEKLNVSMPGLVAFTDARKILEPFHMLKYIADNYLDEYDFYFFVKDTTYIKSRDLLRFVNNISVSEHVYAGGGEFGDSASCSLDRGILLSNSVVKQIAKNLDWCVKNVIVGSYDNIGRCVLHATGKLCKSEIQGQKLSSYALPENYLTTHNNLAHRSKDFESAITIYPMSKPQMFYELDRLFLKVSLVEMKKKIAQLRHSIVTMSSLAPGGQESVTWPVGNQPNSLPVTRFDIINWEYFDENNVYLQSDFSNKKEIRGATKLDIAVILNATVVYLERRYDGQLQFKKFIRGYRHFDPSRGLDYIIDLSFIDAVNAEEIHKRVQVCKPLGKVELVPMPYVMENTRVNMILPVFAGDHHITKKFMEHYASVCMEKHEKTFLMLILLYEPTDAHKGATDDVFLDIKQFALSLSNRYRRDGNKIVWSSINIPSLHKDDSVLLEFAVADLVVKKFSQDSLLLMCQPYMEIRQDYLNRVRMNTILQRQIFSPIPFKEFSPDFTYGSIFSRNKDFDINKNHGHYDVHATQHISFYVKDYISSRKQSESVIPIFRSDRDVSTVLSKYQNTYRNSSNKFSEGLYSMFISCSSVHILRSVEPSLRLRYVDKSCSDFVSAGNKIYDKCLQSKELNLGTRSQLAKVILDYQTASLLKKSR